MSIDSKHFDFFRTISFSDVFSKLDTVKKIQNSIYYKELNTNLKSETPNNIESLQQLLLNNYSTKSVFKNKSLSDETLSDETLELFVYKQVETKLETKIKTNDDIYNLMHKLKTKSNRTVRQSNIYHKRKGENNIIKYIVYTLLFKYIKEFDIKGFIPIFLYIGNKSNFIKKITKQAFTYSKLYYCKYGKYLPIVFVIGLQGNEGGGHAVNYICLPSNKNKHKFYGIHINTSLALNNQFKTITSSIKKGFKIFANSFESKISLKNLKEYCVAKLQGHTSTCMNYSLGLTLNFLFQRNQPTLKILKFCSVLQEQKIYMIQKILVTIGNVSNLFHKFIYDTIFEKFELDQLDKLDQNQIKQIPKLIINLIKNPINDNKSLRSISKFLNECNNAINQWDLKNLEQDMYDNKYEEGNIVENINDNFDEYMNIEINKKKNKKRNRQYERFLSELYPTTLPIQFNKTKIKYTDSDSSPKLHTVLPPMDF